MAKKAEQRSQQFCLKIFDEQTLKPHDAEPSLRTDPSRKAAPVPITDDRVSANDGILGYMVESDGQYVFNPIPVHEHLLQSSTREFHSVGFEQKLEQRTVAPAENTHEKQLSERKPSVATVEDVVAEPAAADNDGTDTIEQSSTRNPRRVRRPSRSRAVGSRNSHSSVLAHSVAGSDISATSLPSINTEATYSFHIGDVAALTDFWKTRLKECTLTPLRKVLEKWVSIRWPKRRKWPYDRTEKPTTERAPGWPKGVRYKEPAHLKQVDCVELICYLLLAHREKDDKTGRYRIQWIKTLRETAEYTLKWISDGEFANSKPGSDYSRKFKECFQTQIWPSVMETAQNFEDHVAQYDLYEGKESNNPDAQKGKQITWSKIKRMPKVERRKREPPKKRARRALCNAVEEVDGDDMNDTNDDCSTVMQTENGESEPGDLSATKTMSFLSTLRDRSISPATTVSDEETPARFETSTITPNLESKIPAVYSQHTVQPHSLWNRQADDPPPPSCSYPSLINPTSVPCNAEAMASGDFSPSPLLRVNNNTSYGYQPGVSEYFSSEPGASSNSSFLQAEYLHLQPLTTPMVKYSSEVKDECPHIRAQQTTFRFPQQAAHPGSGYRMDIQYNPQPMSQRSHSNGAEVVPLAYHHYQ